MTCLKLSGVILFNVLGISLIFGQDTRSHIWQKETNQALYLVSEQLVDRIARFEESITDRIASKMAQFEEKITQLETKIEQKMADQETRIAEQFEEKITEQKTEIVELKRDIAEINEAEPVGFSAYLSREQQLSAGDKIVYNSVFTNLGQHYSTSNGVFTCPVDGVYVFYTRVRAGSSSYYSTYMKHEHAGVTRSIAYTFTQDEIRDSSSALAITQCHTGDLVYVINAHYDRTYAGTLINTFSGFLLKAT